jgi:ABC-2 type transport system ATP-binding protein
VERAELTFATAEDLMAAASALADGDPEVDEDARIVRVPTDGSGTHMRRLLDDLADRGVHVTHLGMHRPSLDDVFLSLTGPGRHAPVRPLEATAP